MGRVSFADNVEEHRFDQIEEIDEQQETYSVYPYEDDAENGSWAGALPKKQGLYDPALEKDACGVGFAAHIKGKPSHKIVTDGMFTRWAREGWQLADWRQHETCSAT